MINFPLCKEPFKIDIILFLAPVCSEEYSKIFCEGNKCQAVTVCDREGRTYVNVPDGNVSRAKSNYLKDAKSIGDTTWKKVRILQKYDDSDQPYVAFGKDLRIFRH